MDTCDSEIVKDCNDPYFHTSNRKSTSIIQGDIGNITLLCNRDVNIIQGVCESTMHTNNEEDKESNNNMFFSHELDMMTEELDQKDYECAISMSDSDSPSASNDHVVEDSNLSTVFQGDWPMDKMYWNEENDIMIASSMESDLHPDTASMMSFDSSMTSSVLNQMSDNSDRLHAKADVVYTLLSMLHTHDKMEVSEMLLTMSNSRENCVAMIESGCLPLLVQLLHDRTEKQTFMAYRESTELRKRSSQILHNIVFSQPDDKKGRREARVLRLLEQVREFSDLLRISQYEINDNDKAQCSDQQLVPTVAALMKLSFDEEHRHAMCLLGGLQAIAELVEIDQEVHGCASDQYCVMIRRYSGMALTNLTFGDGTNKTLLCSMKPFMYALVAQLHSTNEDLRQVTASVLRNLSWRADPESKKILREVGAVTTLMKVAMDATKESSLKSILSALWNLSAHCSENKADICAIDGALGFLVGTLTYKSGCKNLAVVENGGGILRNVSSHIALQNDHRITLRKHNCLQILLHHLKSPSLTVVSNACGTLWNLSARNAQDQRSLWEMGAVGMLKKLINSKHKMISMGSSAALKNLLSAMPPGLDSNMGLSISDCNSSMVSLHVRKQQMLFAEIDQNLSETCDNTDSPKSSPTYKKKTVPRRTQSAPAYRQGIPTRVGNKPQIGVDGQNAEKFSFEMQSNQRQGSPTHAQDQTQISRMMGKTNFVNTSSNSFKRNDVHNSPHEERGLSPKDHRHRVASPMGLRPHSYPSQIVKPNVKQTALSHSMYRNDHHHETESIQMSVSDERSPKFRSKIRNSKYDELECQELPVDYSLKYSDETSQCSKNSSKNSSESKIPLPKVNNYVDQSCRPSAIVPPMFVKHTASKQRAIPKMAPSKSQSIANSSFNEYTETDLDEMDQVVDYSQRYHERHNIDERRLREKPFRSNSLPRQHEKEAHTSKLVGNCEDTVKVYCTEDTPVNFSSASSLTDLCDIDSLASDPRRHQYDIPVLPSCKSEKISEYVRGPDVNDMAVSGDKEGKIVKSGEEGTYAETPLMFSRCSSLGSLSSFDQPSIPDDRSSVSDFSRMASGIVSPSDLPDSPSQTMPTSPNRKQQNPFPFEKKDISAMNTSKNLISNTMGTRQDMEAFDDVHKTYVMEGTPCGFSTASSFSSLTIESGDENVRASLVKKPFVNSQCPASEKKNGNGTKNMTNELPGHLLQKAAPGVILSCQGAESTRQKWNQSHAVNVVGSTASTTNVCNPLLPSKNYGFAEDTIKVYNTEGTPNLSHSASYSDLSMLSFCAEKYTCEPSLEASYAESYASEEDGVAELHMKWQNKENVEKPVPSFSSSQEHSDNSSVCDENQLLMQCIQAGMPKPPTLYAAVPSSNEVIRYEEKIHIPSQLKKSSAPETRNISQTECNKFFETGKEPSISLQHKIGGDQIARSSHSKENLKTVNNDGITELKNGTECQKQKSSTKDIDMEETRHSNAHLVEGTPVSFSCNSSLSSLSIESGDEPDCNIWKMNDFAPSNLNVEDKYRGAGTEILQSAMFVQTGASGLDNSDKTAYYEKAAIQNCLNPENRTREQIRKNDMKFELNNQCKSSEDAAHQGLPCTKENLQLLSEGFSAIQETTSRSIPKQNNFDQTVLATKTSTANQRFFTPPNTNQSLSNQKSHRHDNRQTPKTSNSVLQHNQVAEGSVSNMHQPSSFPTNGSTISETALSDYEEELLQKCILAGMPKPKNIDSTTKISKNTEVDCKSINAKPARSASAPKNVSDAAVLEYEEALLQKCILAGMPKPKPLDVSTRQYNKIKTTSWLNDGQPLECAGMNSIPDSKLSEYEEGLLQQCISAGMPKLIDDSTKQCVNVQSNASQINGHNSSANDNETQFSDYDEALLQQCIMAGMPKPKPTGATMKPSNILHINNQRKNIHVTHESPSRNDQRNTVFPSNEKVQLQKCISSEMSKPLKDDAIPNQLNKSELCNILHSTQHYSDKTMDKELFDGQVSRKKSEPRQNSPIMQAAMKPESTQKQQNIKQNMTSSEGGGDDDEEALLQKCILAGMPKQKSDSPNPTVNTHYVNQSDKISSKVLFDKHTSKNQVSSVKCNQIHESCLKVNCTPSEKNPSETIVSAQKSKPSNVNFCGRQGNLQDSTDQGLEQCLPHLKSQNANVSCNKFVTEHVQSCSKPDEMSTEENILSPEEEEALLQKCILSGMPKQEKELLTEKAGQPIQKDFDCTEEGPHISVQEFTEDEDDTSAEQHNLALEAQKLTNDMLEALIDGADDMTVSTLSCMSEIENVTPPSFMGEMGCLSLTNSICSKDLKPIKSKKGCVLQKETLLKELQLSRLGSDSDLPGRKNKLSVSTLSLSTSTDVLENINPPSALDISLTGSIGSLDSFQSDILDSKSEDRIQPDISDENSMNERFCKAAAMVEMYTKEFSNITGGKASNDDDFYSSNGLHINMTTDAFEDNTEPACDTIASDIEFVDELPCDEEDLGSETLLAPQLSSLNKEELGDGSTENLTFTLTEEPPVLMNDTEEDGVDCIISDDDLRENADLILSSLKKIHISESSDFGGLMSNGLLEDETLSLVSNESDEDSLSPGGVFSDGHSYDKNNESSLKVNNNIIPVDQKSGRSIARVLPTCKLPKVPKKLFFAKSHTVNSEMESPNTESDHSVVSEYSTASAATVKSKITSGSFVNMGTFTRRKATNSNIPNISSQQCGDVAINSLKSQTFSSRDSIESCSTSNSVSSLSSCGDASSVKSSGKKKTAASRISSIWKNSNKSRSKNPIDSGKVKSEKSAKIFYNLPKESLSDQEISLSPALQRSRSQSYSPLTLSRSSTDEKISAHQDSKTPSRRPVTLMLFKRNESPKLNARPTGSSPVVSDKVPGGNLVTAIAPSQGSKSSLPVRKSMIPKIGDHRVKAERSAEQSGSGGKQKPCVVTMV